MTKLSAKLGAYESRSVKDNLVLVMWIFVWMASLTVADKAALYDWWPKGWISIAAIALNIMLGFVMIRFFLKMLANQDELMRRIQLNALSIALGISLVGCAAYSLLVTWGYIIDEEVSDIFVLMTVTYALSSLVLTIRYR